MPPKLDSIDEVLHADDVQVLDDLIEYANKFHHDTNPAWDRVSVVKVVSAANENLARQWKKRHLEWRKSFVMNDREGLLRLRSEVQMSAKQFCDSISEREVAGRLPGSCSLCEPSTPKSTA